MSTVLPERMVRTMLEETKLEQLKCNLVKDLVVLEESNVDDLTKDLIESVYEDVYKILLKVGNYR
jgi:hypothetical protein